MALKGFRSSCATPADRVCNAANFSATRTRRSSPNHSANVLSLQDHACRFLIVPRELRCTHANCPRALVPAFVEEVLVTQMTVLFQRPVEYPADWVSFGEHGIIPFPEQLRWGAIQDHLSCGIHRADDSSLANRKHARGNTLENIPRQPLHFFQSSSGGVIVKKHDDRRTTDRIH